MKKKILLAALAVSIMSLSACNSETGSATNDTAVSGAEESKAEVTDSAEIAETSETEETSEEAEEPQLEPVIALSYGDYEFDISNMTYKDLLAFFQAIGYPASSDNRDYEVEPYGYLDIWHGPEITINVGDTEVSMTVSVYNPTGETIRALDAKIYSISHIDDLLDIIDEDVKVFGVSLNTFDEDEYEGRTSMLDNAESQISKFGYNRNCEEFIKRLDDGREVSLDTEGDMELEITPVYDYGTY